MGAQMRVYRQRSRSVASMKKITNAMELIAAGRVVKARTKVIESGPYTHAVTRAVSAVATHSTVEHPLTTEPESIRRAAVVVMASDRGLAGAYASNVMKEAGQLIERLKNEGKEVVLYLVGRKAVSYYRFRGREFAQSWEGFTDSPKHEHAAAIADRIIEDFLRDYDAGGHDEIHIVYTRFKSMVTQEPRVLRLLPLEVVEGVTEPVADVSPLYSFEPNADEVLDALLPLYVTNRIWTCLLGAAASELAARQRAMKSATDNAEELIKTYTRLSNQARQAEITQEISEIVGGASALADAAKKK